MLKTIFLAGGLAAATVSFPAPTGPVVDTAEVVPSAVEARVEQELVSFQQRTGIAIAAAVVPTTGSLDANAYANELAKQWGLITTPFDRAVVLVVDVGKRRVGMAVSLGLLTDLPANRQEALLRTVVGPDAAAGDVGNAVELGTEELRRTLGDTTVTAVPELLPPKPVLPARDRRPWPALLFVIAVVVVLLGSRALVRRRRAWAINAPVLWGSGWGRATAAPTAALARRYRRVRDAVHVAESESGLRLCFWLGPVVGEPGALADELFAHAVHDGHAVALVLVGSNSPVVELRVSPAAADRVTPACAAGVIELGLDPEGALVTVAGRIARHRAPDIPAPGGVITPDLY